ncbi:MAG: THUMP domain-containing protein [Nitrospiraceae bacterium]|nr:THUMP domain-containing protein [Nitrospiraceae bacterium]
MGRDTSACQWNILATAKRRQESYLLRLLKELGEFRHSGYRDVVFGYVASVQAFLDALEDIRLKHPGKLGPLGQVVPIERNFQFEAATFLDKAMEAVSPYIAQLEGIRFFVRVMRRGHKGEISSQEIEKKLDNFILESLKKNGKEAVVNIEEFDKMIVLETAGNLAGAGLITREVKERYPFIKIK